jgi:hypothetical protein
MNERSLCPARLRPTGSVSAVRTSVVLLCLLGSCSDSRHGTVGIPSQILIDAKSGKDDLDNGFVMVKALPEETRS